MACLICTDMPLNDLRKINEELNQGVRNIRDIAAEFQLDHETLQRHDSVCNQQGEDEIKVLRRNARQLQVLIESFQTSVANGEHLQYDADDDSVVDGRTIVRNLLDAQREYRETASVVARLQNAGNLAERITADIVGPMVSTSAIIIIEEMNRLREELFGLTKAYESLHPRIKKAVDDSILRAGARLKTDMAHDLVSKIEAIVGNKSSTK